MRRRERRVPADVDLDGGGEPAQSDLAGRLDRGEVHERGLRVPASPPRVLHPVRVDSGAGVAVEQTDRGRVAGEGHGGEGIDDEELHGHHGAEFDAAEGGASVARMSAPVGRRVTTGSPRREQARRRASPGRDRCAAVYSDRCHEHRLRRHRTSSGVGRALAQFLARHGVTVVGLDRREPPDREIAHVRCDLTDPRSIDTAVERLDERVDALANVAGLPGTSPADEVLAVNFLGMRHLTERLLPRIQRGGSVVNVSSSEGRHWVAHLAELRPLLATTSFDDGLRWCRERRPERSVYDISKEAVLAYTDGLLDADLAGRGPDERRRARAGAHAAAPRRRARRRTRAGSPASARRRAATPRPTRSRRWSRSSCRTRAAGSTARPWPRTAASRRPPPGRPCRPAEPHAAHAARATSPIVRHRRRSTAV